MKLRFALLYFGAWLVFYALYMMMLLSTRGSSLVDAQSASFFTVMPAAVMGLAVWWFARRREWAADKKLRFFGSHVAGAILYGVLWGGITLAQIATFAPQRVLEIFVDRALGWQILMGIMMYSLIAGVAYLIQVTERLAEQRSLASRAELLALRSQLNPHFLFNTLHSITSLARENGKDAEDALVRFGSLLRYVLDSSRKPGEDATLEEELEFVRGYLAIEKMRLGSRLEVSEDIDPEALECVIPVLTLQPIVENAVRHGIAPRARGGNVAISARTQDGRLSIVVEDDGVGADSKQIASGNGVGLSLVERRLRARYAGPTSMTVDTSEGKGTTVTLSMPAT